MGADSINQNRYRMLRGGLLLVAGASLGGALIVLQLPHANPLEWSAFIGAALVSLALLPVATKARDRGDRAALEHLARAMIVLATLLLMQRLAWSMYGPMIHDESIYLFRPIYAFLPFLYLASIAIMRARIALRFCWFIWAAVMALTIPALAIHAGFSFARAGMTTLTVWLLLANPLFILMMHALPHYEDQLDQSRADLAAMRERAALVGQLAESEQRFNLVVEGLDVGVWDRWIGPPERRWWSPRFFELLGYRPEELKPSEETLKQLLHPDDRERVWNAGTEQLRQGDTMDVDFRLHTAHRGYRWFNSHGKAVRDANGKLVRLAGSLTDIHDKRTAEETLHAVQSELMRLSFRDPLTDLHNRRYFEEHFQREWERARRNKQPLALLLVDLDHFKAYNDRYGHPAGDMCLQKVAEVLTRCANRATDIVARLGGEEFGVVLPQASAIGAAEVARRMRDEVERAGIMHEAAPSGVVTLSCGVAASEGPDGPGPALLKEQADKALYEAKRRGRNSVVRFGEAAPATPAGASPTA